MLNQLKMHQTAKKGSHIPPAQCLLFLRVGWWFYSNYKISITSQINLQIDIFILTGI